ncbi:putative transporter C36.03c [Erysiphe neolycopersici]|uniref:Putative transporter C36.03c n=1 Tax=Erysiphe neolycopersici TaxID=212602 RepID=A0A420HKV5_9PEZI|nr:putative transporter C36.03c [Erysiphe neolycopersici]
MDPTHQAVSNHEYDANHSVSFDPSAYVNGKLKMGRVSSSSTVTVTNVSATTSVRSVPVCRSSTDDDLQRSVYASVRSQVLSGNEFNKNDSSVTIQGRESKVSLPECGVVKWYPPPLPDSNLYLIDFDGPDDPTHAQNWPMKKKVLTTAMLAFNTMISVFSSSIFSTTISTVTTQYNVSIEVGILGLSLFVLGFAFGPIFWAPVSELKGRRLILVWSGLGFSIFQVGTAVAKDIQTILLCRFWGGIFGAAPMAVVGAVIVDIYDNRTRGIAMATFSMVVFISPLIAPLIGGFIIESSLGWRWTQWLCAILGITCFFMNLFFLEESFAPAILVAKAAKIRRKTHNWAIHAKHEEIEIDLREFLSNYFARPIQMLFKEPIVLLISIYMSFIFGLLYLFLTAYPMVFQGIHGMSSGISGLTFLGMITGMIMAGIFIILVQPSYNRKLIANNNVSVPEWRLPPMMVGSIAFAIGVFWFAWSGHTSSIHWIIPTLSGILTGFGLLIIFIQSLNYIIDAYLMYAASALAANSILRFLAGAIYPLFARSLFNSLGIKWSCTILGGIATLLAPIPVVLLYFGHRIRARSSFNPQFKKGH